MTHLICHVCNWGSKLLLFYINRWSLVSLRTTVSQKSVCFQRRMQKGRRSSSETLLMMPGFLASPSRRTPSSLMLGCELCIISYENTRLWLSVTYETDFMTCNYFCSWITKPCRRGEVIILDRFSSQGKRLNSLRMKVLVIGVESVSHESCLWTDQM